MEPITENNSVKLGGVICSELVESHELFGEKFYKFHMEVERLSGAVDKLPVIISERLIDIKTFKVGTQVIIEGQYRSYNQEQPNGKSKLILTTFARSAEITELNERNRMLNNLLLIGTICKPPIYRKTPLGRDIADVLVAVNRSYNKSDYIPCILWGRTAKYCKNLAIGTLIKLEGRVQAREYEKKYEDGTVEKKVAYEVSVARFEEYTSNQDNEQENKAEYIEESGE